MTEPTHEELLAALNLANDTTAGYSAKWVTARNESAMWARMYLALAEAIGSSEDVLFLLEGGSLDELIRHRESEKSPRADQVPIRRRNPAWDFKPGSAMLNGSPDEDNG